MWNFFYYEPESTTYLTGTIRIFRNKYQAIKELWKEAKLEGEPEDIVGEIDPEIVEELQSDKEELERYYNLRNLTLDYYDRPEYYDALLMTPDEFMNLNIVKRKTYKLPQVRRYVGDRIIALDLEDKYDQPLCEIGKSLGIDLIVLTHLIGSHQIVSEVLDTRPRMESFNNLIYPST